MRQTIEHINDRNREFWLEQSKLAAGRLSDETLRNVAIADLSSEAVRGIPLKQRKSIEKALEDAEKIRTLVQSSFSRTGGKALKCDALQTLIEEIAVETPRISARQLQFILNGCRGAGTVTSIDKESDVRAGEPRLIHFAGDDEKPQSAPLSGLKDRLHRARRKINSR